MQIRFQILATVQVRETLWPIEEKKPNPIKKDTLKLTLSHLLERGKIKAEDAKDILDNLVDKKLVSKSDSSDILFSIRK